MDSTSPLASLEAARAREILADGEWHDYEQVVRELIKLIPPGRAARANDDARYRQALHRARAKGQSLDEKPPRVRPVDPDRARESGARSLVRKMLHGAGYETRPPGRAVGKQIRDPRAAARKNGSGKTASNSSQNGHADT